MTLEVILQSTRRLAALTVLIVVTQLLVGCGKAGPSPNTTHKASGTEAAHQSSADDSSATATGTPAEAQATSAAEMSASDAASTELPGRPEVELLHPRTKRSWLGLRLEATQPKKPGVRIADIVSGSPAERSELRINDVILKVNDTRVESPREVGAVVAASPHDTEITLSILRGSGPTLVRARVEGMPEIEDRLRLAFIGRPAPSIDGVVTFQGSAASLKDLQGRVVIVEFWASWCGVCRYLAPVLEDWQNVYQSRGLDVVGVTTDDPKQGARAAAQVGMEYTLVSDPGGRVSRSYMASSVPSIFLLDRDGVVADVIVGYSRARLAQMRAQMEELLDAPR